MSARARAAVHEPVILAGTTGSGTRYVQFWTEHARIAGRRVAVNAAEMYDGDLGAPDRLRIAHDTPDSWMPAILAAFDRFRAGGDITPTHTADFPLYGQPPVFTPVDLQDGGA